MAAIFSSTQPSLRARVLPRFPANVIAGTGITIIKSGATYTFAANPLGNIASGTVLGRAGAGVGPGGPLVITGGLETATGPDRIQTTFNQRLKTLVYTITGSPITTGVKGDIWIGNNCSIFSLVGVGGSSGSAVIDLWRTPNGGIFPPTVANSILGSTLFTMTGTAASATNVSSNPSWSPGLGIGDILRININSVSGFSRLEFIIHVQVLN